VRRTLLRTFATGRWGAAVAVARVAAGAIFVAFGVAKFTAHGSEVASFRKYGLLDPDVFVYAIGSLELVGGLFLIAGLLTRLAALALSADMIGAITVSGIGEGEAISLTLAPALLLVMIVLLRTGAGAASLDARIS
jgi:putative oxidoreductase